MSKIRLGVSPNPGDCFAAFLMPAGAFKWVPFHIVGKQRGEFSWLPAAGFHNTLDQSSCLFCLPSSPPSCVSSVCLINTRLDAFYEPQAFPFLPSNNVVGNHFLLSRPASFSFTHQRSLFVCMHFRYTMTRHAAHTLTAIDNLVWLTGGVRPLFFVQRR